MQEQKAEVGFSSNEQQQFVSEQQEAYNYTMGSLYVGDLAPEVSLDSTTGITNANDMFR